MIMGDDIGWYNTSIYNRGDMGYQTPNIDRIGKEGAMFLSWYAQQSCTAGRSSFITGQSVFRTGLSKVGVPAAPIGRRGEREKRRQAIPRAAERDTLADAEQGKQHN